ncbi:MAG: hypothetical protein RMM58_00380 [Chloroflexota bacterium]|nr:hypothetical protein [Dehalococcoidia bacterium]MDW8252315.1 hypothetical protein [Chloroflexota bacterium]
MPALILAVGLSAVAIVPLLSPGFFHNHAGLLPAYLAARPLGWATALGLPALGPLPHAALALVQLVSPEPASALKLLHGAALLAGTVGAFAAGAALWRLARPTRAADAWQGGVLAATLYAAVPLRLAATYVRGDLGEAFAGALLPWLAALALGGAPPAALAGGALALALAQPALAAGGALAALALRWAAGRRAFPGPAVALASGVAVGVAAWLPSWRSVGVAPVSPDSVQPAHLLLARWGYGTSPEAGMPIQLGVVAVGGGLIALLAGQWPGRLKAALAGITAVAVALSLAGPLWSPLVAFVGQPWLLLGLAALTLVLLATGLPLPAGREAVASVIALALVALVAVLNALQPIPLAALSRGDPVLAVFGDRVVLLASHRDPPAAPRTITVDWQALADGVEDYRVRLRLLDRDGAPVVERDFVPLNGVRPTGGWVKGEVIRDTLPLPGGLPPGSYRVGIGLVRANGERLPVRDQQGGRPADEVILAEVTAP